MTDRPRTPAERQAAARERRRALGLVKLELWARPAHHAKIRAYAGRLDGKTAQPRSNADVHDVRSKD
jgi:hypothetical protein